MLLLREEPLHDDCCSWDDLWCWGVVLMMRTLDLLQLFSLSNYVAMQLFCLAKLNKMLMMYALETQFSSPTEKPFSRRRLDLMLLARTLRLDVSKNSLTHMSHGWRLMFAADLCIWGLWVWSDKIVADGVVTVQTACWIVRELVRKIEIQSFWVAAQDDSQWWLQWQPASSGETLASTRVTPSAGMHTRKDDMFPLGWEMGGIVIWRLSWQCTPQIPNNPIHHLILLGGCFPIWVATWQQLCLPNRTHVVAFRSPSIGSKVQLLGACRPSFQKAAPCPHGELAAWRQRGLWPQKNQTWIAKQSQPIGWPKHQYGKGVKHRLDVPDIPEVPNVPYVPDVPDVPTARPGRGCRIPLKMPQKIPPGPKFLNSPKIQKTFPETPILGILPHFRGIFLGFQNQGESNIHQIVVTVSCRLCPPFPEGEFAVFRYRKTPCFYGESYYFYRISCVNSLFPTTGKLGAKGDAKWWTSIRCMFNSLWQNFGPEGPGSGHLGSL